MGKQIPVSKREQAVALKIVGMLRDECADNLVVAVKALALANAMFQTAFQRTVSNFSGLVGRLEKGIDEHERRERENSHGEEKKGE